MSLTYQQAKIVRGTVPILKEHGERISSIFYATMLQEHPELKNYFNTVHQQNGRQPRALTSIILAFAANISHTSEIIERLERICHKHCSLGIQPQHYGIVGEYLIRAFREVLGPKAWTTEVQAAWTDAYCILARMMMGREGQLYREFEPWQGWRRLKIDRKVAESEDVYSFYLVPMPASAGSGKSGSSSRSGYSSGRSSYSSSRSSKNSSSTSVNTLGSNSHTIPAGNHSGILPYYQPGQYLSVRLLLPDLMSPYSSGKGGLPAPVGGGIVRPGTGGKNRAYYYQCRQYTLSDRWRPDVYRISIKRDGGTRYANAVSTSFFHPGVVSNAMCDHLKVGDTLEVSHPCGEFFLNISNAEALFSGRMGPGLGNISRSIGSSISSSGNSVPLVLISAGVGASPMMAMLASVAATQPNRAITYVHGSRYKPVVYDSQIRAFQKKMPRLRTVYYLPLSAQSVAAAGTPTPRSTTNLPRMRRAHETLSNAASSLRSFSTARSTNGNANGNSTVRDSTTTNNSSVLSSADSTWSSAASLLSVTTSSTAAFAGPLNFEFDGRVDLFKLLPNASAQTSVADTTATTTTTPASSSTSTAPSTSNASFETASLAPSFDAPSVDDASITAPLASLSIAESTNSVASSNAEDLDLLFLKNHSTEYYVCGPEGFMLDMAVLLVQEFGVMRNRIKFELFSTGELEEDQRDGRLAYLKSKE